MTDVDVEGALLNERIGVSASRHSKVISNLVVRRIERAKAKTLFLLCFLVWMALNRSLAITGANELKKSG